MMTTANTALTTTQNSVISMEASKDGQQTNGAKSGSQQPTSRRLRGVSLSYQDEKDLRRVFEFLAGCARRDMKAKLMKGKIKERNELNRMLETEDFDDTEDAEEELGVRIDVLDHDIDTLEAELKRMEEEGNKRVNAADLDYALKSLGRTCTKKQIEFMIWEVDENLDGYVDWEEFQLMYFRNMHDTTGLEPFELFNIVQFMTFDQDTKGYITEDDTMSTLFVRYGRAHVEKEMAKLFGDKLKAAGGEGVLTLGDYLKVASVRNPRMKEHRLKELNKSVEGLKPPRSARGGAGVVEHASKWKPI